MSKFNELCTALRGAVQGLLDNTNVEKIAGIAKTIDGIEAEYNSAENEAKNAKENLVKYVKEYAFKEKPDDETGTAEPPCLDDAIADAFKDLK